MANKRKLTHIAFIMDGNGRWAKERHLPRHLGHKKGCENVCDIYEECIEQDIKVISLYAFSTENWNRPDDELDHLFKYLDLFFKREIDRIDADGTRLIISGDISKLPLHTQKTVKKAIERTKNNDKQVFNICLNYGGKDEILRATKLFAKDVKEGKRNIEDLDASLFESYLYTAGLPPVDLLIRTSGEMRTSNFMPWQLAYAEFLFPKTYWPAFSKEEFRKCIDDYYKRDRRFGAIEDGK